MGRFDDDGNSRRIPLFQAAAILIVVIALLGVLADRFMSSTEETGAAELPAQAGTVLAGAQPVPEASGHSTALLQHWESILPLIGELERAWDSRDAPALRRAHDDLVRAIETVPHAPPDASEADRTYQTSYREALVFLEDGVDDLREGLEIPDPAEWEEGMLDVRTARVRLDAVIDRIRSGR